MKFSASFSLLLATLTIGAVAAQKTSKTDFDAIYAAIASVDQTEAVPSDAWPSAPVDSTETIADVTAAGDIAVASNSFDVDHYVEQVHDNSKTPVLTVPVTKRSKTIEYNKGNIVKRLSTNYGYQQVFAADNALYESKGLKDASVQGTAYLTYTVVTNDTARYEEAKTACFKKCDNTKGCTFVNLFQEKDNNLLDWVFSEKSDLKCALWADVHPASEKTNAGGQQLKQPKYNEGGDPQGYKVNHVENSVGFRKPGGPVYVPETVPGYNAQPAYVGAIRGDGYMGYTLLSKYDPVACSQACNARQPGQDGRPCIFFNIWRAEVNGMPISYTCSMYTQVHDASKADNYGQGTVDKNGQPAYLKVTESRGYAKQ
ncbi:hypothetical protein ACQY0O_003555 [Thecaphora frezii]